MPRPKGGLGRGLSALIPQDMPDETAPAPEDQPPAPSREAHAGGLASIPVERISPNPRQPRQHFNEAELEELAGSIRTHGLLQPLVVARGDAPGTYHLIAGERRWRAAFMAGLEEVPALVKEATSRDMLELALVENVQRSDLNPLEEASAYQALVEEFGLKQEEVAARVGKSRVAVGNSLRLLRLPAPAREALAAGQIDEGHARALLQVPDEPRQLKLLEMVLAKGLSVRQVEALARRLAAEPDPGEEPEDTSRPLYDPMAELQDRFRSALGTKVQLSRSRRGGKLVIYFYSDEELDRIYETIVREE